MKKPERWLTLSPYDVALDEAGAILGYLKPIGNQAEERYNKALKWAHRRRDKEAGRTGRP